MRHKRQLAAAVLLLFAPAALTAQSIAPPAAPERLAASTEGKRDYAQISLEDLLNKDVAVAATKTRVDVAKAPVSVTVLTPEDIRRSGATRLGDLLRTVPGIDVLEAFPGYVSVSARGTSEAFVNNMLVLIDGRRLETQLAGVPFLEEAPVRLEDIKRIEVVKGPVGAVYGTNALAGVISITTYSPDEVPGTLVSLTGGSRDTYGGTLRHAGRVGEGRWGYKLVGGFSYTSTWGSLQDGDTAPTVATRKADALLRLERRGEDGSQVEVEAGVSKGDLASLTIVTNQTQTYTYPHLRIGYGRADLHALLTYNPQSLELRERQGPVQPLIDRWSHAVNLSVDRTLRPAARSTLTLGGNARYQRSEFTSLGVPRQQVVGSLFAQNEQILVQDRLSVFGALGLSRHPEIPTQVDANAAVVVSPARSHSFRLSYGRGHRDPAFLENFIDFRRKFGPADGYQSSNPDLQPEQLDAFELGYHGSFQAGSSRVQFFAEGFREQLRHLIGVVTQNVSAGTLPAHPTVTVLQQFRNVEDRDGHGFEVGGAWERPSVRLATHYAFQSFEDAKTGVKVVRNIPRHKLSAGLHLRGGRAELDVWVHSVGKTIDEEGYVLLNPRVGVRIQSLELSLQAFNALNDRHVETANERGIRGERIGRSVALNVTFAPGRR